MYTLTQADVDAGFVENIASVSATGPSGTPVTDMSDDPADPGQVDPDSDGNPDDPTVTVLSATVVTPDPTNDQPSGPLAFSGSNSWLLILLAMTLMILGALSAFASRSLRTRREPVR